MKGINSICLLFIVALFGILELSEIPFAFAAEKPKCLQILAKAERLEDKQIGEAGVTSQTYKAYEEAFKQSDKISKEDLNWLLSTGSPAGKIYAAMLLRGTGKANDANSFGKLTEDQAEVSLISGCELMKEKLNTIARNFIKSGNCFGISYLKKKSP